MTTPGRGTRGRREAQYAVLFLAPAVAIYTIFLVYPLLGSMRLSFFSFQPGGAEQFAGLANFQTLLTDPYWSHLFFHALLNTIVFFGIHMLVQNPLGLLLALLLTSHGLRGRAVLRGLIFAPTVLSVVVVGFIWQLILSPLWGVAPTLMKQVGLGSFFQPWLGQEGSALPVIGLMSVWQYVGLPMLLFSAALLSISDEVTDAARVDGAGALRTFWSIRLPLILPTVGIVAVLTFVGNMNAFDLVYTTQGTLAGPNNATDLVGTLFYRTFFGFFTQQPNPAIGTTIASVTFGLVALVVCLYLFGVQRRLQRYEA